MLRGHIARTPLAEVFEKLRRSGKPANLKALEFLEAIKRDDSFVIDFTFPDRPQIRPVYFRARDLAQYVLAHSTRSLTPEEIIEQGCHLLGENFSPPSPFSLANGLKPEDGFYLLDRRAYGLRKHFRTPAAMWPIIRSDFFQLLKEGKSSSFYY